MQCRPDQSLSPSLDSSKSKQKIIPKSITETQASDTDVLGEFISDIDKEISRSFSYYSPVHHFEKIHGTERYGDVIFWLPKSGSRKNLKIISEEINFDLILDDLVGMEDVFMSVNEFNGWRKEELLKSLRACFVDIDNPKLTLTETLDAVKKQGLPEPSIATESGNGFHLYWMLEATPSKALQVWKEVQNKIARSLKDIGADQLAKDPARLLRVIGTVNSKNGSRVRGHIISDKYYSFHLLSDLILGKRKFEKKRKAIVRDITASRAGKSINKPSFHSKPIRMWWYVVYQDILKIIEYTFSGKVLKGTKQRDLLLFHLANALSWFVNPDALQSEIDMMAQKYFPDLSETKVTRYTSQIIERSLKAIEGKKIEYNGKMVDARYSFRRDTLWTQFSHLISNDLLPELRAIIPDKLHAERKRKRDRSRSSLSREEYEAQAYTRRCHAIKLYSEGFKQKDIALKLEISKGRVSQILREHKATLKKV